jgi:hypothetical protein
VAKISEMSFKFWKLIFLFFRELALNILFFEIGFTVRFFLAEPGKNGAENLVLIVSNQV